MLDIYEIYDDTRRTTIKTSMMVDLRCNLYSWREVAAGGDLHKQYIDALRAHDWYYHMSDDHGAWRRGKLSMMQLEFLRKELDRDYAIWNANCPDGFQVNPATGNQKGGAA